MSYFPSFLSGGFEKMVFVRLFLEGVFYVMKRKCTVAASLIVFILSTASCAWSAPHLRFATASAGGLWYILGGAMADLFNKAGLQTSVTSGGTIPNIANTQSGKTDLALTIIFPGMLKNTDGLKGKTFDKVTLIGNMYPQYLYFVIRKDYAQKHNIKSIRDLFEKDLPFRYATLARGNVTEYLVRQVFDVHNTSVEALLKKGGKVEYGSYDQGADLIIDNHVDLYIVSSGLPLSSILNIETRINIEILPIDDKTMKALQARYGAQARIIPKGSYKCAKKDIPVMGAWTSLICKKDMKDDDVYKITKLIFDNKESLGNAVSAIKALTLEMASKQMEFPIHPGAQRYYNANK